MDHDEVFFEDSVLFFNDDNIIIFSRNKCQND